ncbi:MAG: phytanoyl-CoA dioxygenase family protein [Deltaproteobacteria bacterium]|nr:phytanoyl-CoA dioxygenase family protein [Deltaproteobacteria bacterium]
MADIDEPNRESRARRAYTNEDGTIRAEVAAQRAAARDAEVRARGIDVGYVESLLERVNEDGYVILPHLIPPETIDAIRREAGPFLQHDGRTEFEGYKTRRIYSVIEKTFACNPIVDHPLVMALLDRILQPNYLLSQLQVIEVMPGEIRQPLHHDDGFYPFPRPRKPIGAALIWALDDFTADNGATLVYPGSHRWGDVPAAGIDVAKMVPAVMPAGSAVFFLGTVWHGAGANRTDRPRLAATTQYCEPWARQQENYSLAISRERARQCSEKIQALLGYSMLFPFIGFVDGRDPIRLLRDRPRAGAALAPAPSPARKKGTPT